MYKVDLHVSKIYISDYKCICVYSNQIYLYSHYPQLNKELMSLYGCNDAQIAHLLGAKNLVTSALRSYFTSPQTYVLAIIFPVSHIREETEAHRVSF